MGNSPWDEWSFWMEKMRIINKEAGRARRGCDGTEAISWIWEALTRRLPNGDIPGNAPSAYLDKTIRLEARKYFQREGRILPGTGVDSDSFEPELASRADGSANAKEAKASAREAVVRLFELLPQTDGEILRLFFGVGCDRIPVADIAKRLGISVSAAYKRRANALGKALRLAQRLHLNDWGIHS